MKHLKCILTIFVLLLSSSLVVQNASAQSCCQGIRGNVDNDVTDEIDISDLVYLVDYMFVGGDAPPCFEEADMNGDDAIDISDLVYLVDYMFTGGDEPTDCPAGPEVVFTDEYGSGVTYEAFLGSFLEAVQVDADSMYAGSQGLVITIPGAEPWWSGGAFTDSAPRDLSVFNALTFWAKASTASSLNVAGIGNDNTGTSKYTAEVNGLALTTEWQKYVIPIPEPSKLDAERGLFYFAEGDEGGGNQIWIDEIIFENLGTITNIRPVIPTTTLEVTQGAEVTINGSTVTFDVGGSVDVEVKTMMGYFNFTSTNEAVVSVGVDGVITAVGAGTADLTATLGTAKALIPALGTVTVNVSGPEATPSTPAPTPTVPSDSVVSLFSDVYTSATIDTWSAGWDNADVEDYMIGSDNTKKYTNLVFAGIEFTTTMVDASAMSHFHMDVWTPNPTEGLVYKVKLVDFGGDGAWGGGDDVEHELVFDDNTMSSESWVSIDVPLANFTNLVTTGHLAQMIISGDLPTVYLDNIYFYDAGLPTEPLVSAPTPTQDAGDVFSVFSDTYTSTEFDVWSPGWDMGDVVGFTIASDTLKKYTNWGYVLSEYSVGVTGPQDISSMTHFHMDVWTPDATNGSSEFKIKLVDFGADGNSGGGDDSEHELTFGDATMSTGSWVSLDIPLDDFSGMTGRGNFAQMILSGTYGTFFMDNLYFYDGSAPTAPTTSAPTPTADPGDVVSIYSDSYTDVPIGFWSPEWDGANVTDETVGSDNIKKFVFFGGYSVSEIAAPRADASTMTYVHLDVWTPDAAATKLFKVKLVDFGADGEYSGGDDSEHELTFTDATMSTGSWVSIDVPMADLTGLAASAHIAQLVLSGDFTTVFVDNIYFHQ